MMKISAIVLVGPNSDKNLLKKCLDSLSWCDEIIEHGADSAKGSFSDWRNTATKKAKGDWLFYVDTDEEVPDKLKKEILSVIKKGPALSAYAIPRKNILLGREMKHGGWWPDYVLRLIRKEKLEKWTGKLHEQPKIKGEVGKLTEPLLHTSHRNLTEMVEKTNEWSEIEAKLLFEANHPPVTWWRMVSIAAREFWYRGIKKAGFLDGAEGIMEVIYQMFSRMITYAKLWEMQITKK